MSFFGDYNDQTWTPATGGTVYAGGLQKGPTVVNFGSGKASASELPELSPMMMVGLAAVAASALWLFNKKAK